MSDLIGNTSYLLDTNILSHLIKHPQGLVAQKIAQLGQQTVCTSIVVASEIEYGLQKRNSPALTTQAGIILNAFTILDLSFPVQTHYARVRNQLEKQGQPIGPNDLWIAAHALAIEAVLVTDNVSEFQRVAGLRIENWLLEN
jgi:tRNA(fMet)-specific endonuclease VapC